MTDYRVTVTEISGSGKFTLTISDAESPEEAERRANPLPGSYAATAEKI